MFTAIIHNKSSQIYITDQTTRAVELTRTLEEKFQISLGNGQNEKKKKPPQNYVALWIKSDKFHIKYAIGVETKFNQP